MDAAAMARWATVLWVVWLLCMGASAGLRDLSGRDLRLEEPRHEIKAAGGSLEVWSSCTPSLQEARMGLARLTLTKRGLLLPKYSDSSTLGYVVQGEGVAGLVVGSSLSQTTASRRLRRGDVITVPAGVAHWVYNDGEQELVIVAVSDISGSGESTPFYLVGGQEEQSASMLQGFDPHLLSEAWDMDEDRVHKLLRSQPGLGIVRVEREMDPMSLAELEITANGRPSDENVGDPEGLLGKADFSYSLGGSTPEVSVKDGGKLHTVNSYKLPLLENTRLAANYVRLEQRALTAPSWFSNAHHIVFITRGSGRLEIVSNQGRRLLRADVRAGEAYVQPHFFASIKAAGDEGLEWIALFNHHLPAAEAMAGSTSVFKRMPQQLAAAAFNVEDALGREFQERRRDHALILPPRRPYRFRPQAEAMS